MPVALRALRGVGRPRAAILFRHARDGLNNQPRAVPSCRWNSSDSAADTTKEKPYYVTTPIFYVNAAPHIGHLYSMVLADVFKRWQQVKGKEAVLCTGTDEHGMKIQQAAAQMDMPPKEFCDKNSIQFKELAKLAHISNDFFIRTTDQDHKDAVAKFWLNLKRTLPEKLGLYKGVHEGWYCVSDECFYPEDMVEARIEAQTGKKIMASTQTDNEVEWVAEETWMFPLTKYKDALLKFFDENPEWIKPQHRMSEARAWIENHLEDLSITRPASRLSWGIPDPEDANHTIYVWVDALINYITKAGYGTSWQSAGENMGLWPADLQVIGKDILRFHAVYWPAFLLALDLPLPKQIFCHNHWTMSNQKMSKSLGNVVDPILAMERWDVDAVRYFLVCNTQLSKDMGYSNELIGADREKHLRGNIGNLFYRITHPKASLTWSTLEALNACRKGDFDSADALHRITEGLPQYHSLDEHFEKVRREFQREMDDLRPAHAIRVVFDFMRQTNRYISECEPWKVVRDPDPSKRDLLNWIIYNGAEALRIAAILLQPIMPEKATRLLDELKVMPERRTLEFAEKGKDSEYGTETRHQSGQGRIDPAMTLFPPTSESFDKTSKLARNAKAVFRQLSPNKTNRMSAWLALEAKVGAEKAEEMARDIQLAQETKRKPRQQQ